MKKKEDYFADIWKKFKKKFLDALKIELTLGNKISINMAKDQGKKTNLNPMNLSKKDVDSLMELFELNVTDANKDISKRVNNAILDNTSQRGSNKDLAKMIKGIFDEENSDHFNYKNRFNTIARTESSRVLNNSAFNTAKRLGAIKKYLNDVPDSRQGEDSKVAMRKYGSPEKAIPIDDNFEFTYKKKNYSYLIPPNRPNDREIPIYVFE